MNRNRSCKRCSYTLSDMDPHTICKSCRQPDPQMFYCSEEDCEACTFIRENKPLDAFLRKQELANLQKRLQQFATHHSSSERLLPTNKSLELFNNNSAINSAPNFVGPVPNFAGPAPNFAGPAPNFAGHFENKMSQFNSDILKSVVTGMYRENGGPSSVKFNNSPHTITNVEKKNDNIQDLEKRLFDRVMSSVMNSLSDNKRNETEETNKTSILKTTNHAQVAASSSISSSIDLDKDDCDLNNMMISFLEEFFPDSFSKVNKGTSDSKNEFVVKLSSKACDILAKGTVLGPPGQAIKLANELKVESNMMHWPLKLNAADVLHSSYSKLPSMRLHPKIRHMHSLLFGKLNPSLPSNLLGENFALPELSVELKNEFTFAREQLQRLMLIFSLIDYFSGEKVVQENSSLFILFDLILNHIKSCMERQANFVGLLIQELRRDLLRDADCKIPDAIPKLIVGSVHQSYFFGPYVKELQDIIDNNGPTYCLTSKAKDANVKIFQLPSKFKEGTSVENFLVKLRVFFEANVTSDKEKVSIFENLLPKEIIDRLSKFIKPSEISQMSFEELASMLKRFDCNNSSDILLNRSNFTRTKQSKDQAVREFSDTLQSLLPNCMYGSSERELLRDQFVFGLHDKETQQYLLSKFSWSFEECVDYAEDEEEKGPPGKEDSDEEKLIEYKTSNKKTVEDTNKHVEYKASNKRTTEDDSKHVEYKASNKRTTEDDSKHVIYKASNKRTTEDDSKHVEYKASNKRSTEEEKTHKRKREEKEVEPVVKKQKVEEIKETYFYDYSDPKKKIISVKNLQQWNEYFGFEIKHTYEVYCPWTGQILRA